MTQTPWRDSAETWNLLRGVAEQASNRKRQLLAEYCRGRLACWTRTDVAQAIATRVRFGLGEINLHELERTFEQLRVEGATPPVSHHLWDPWPRTLRAVTAHPSEELVGSLQNVHGAANASIPSYLSPENDACLVELARELFGPLPFRSVELPDGLAQWRDGLALHLARDIRELQNFDELPVLADMLEETGCTDVELLAHCRCGGPHTPGCWALDALLGTPWQRRAHHDWMIDYIYRHPPRCLRGFDLRTNTEATRAVNPQGNPSQIEFELGHPDPTQRPVLLGHYLDRSWPQGYAGWGRILVSPLAIWWEPSGEVMEFFDGTQHGYNCEIEITPGTCVHERSRNPQAEWHPAGRRVDLVYVVVFSDNVYDHEELSEEMHERPQDFFGGFTLLTYCRRSKRVHFVTNFECA